MKKFIILFLINIMYVSVCAQDTNTIKYLPLQVGNLWSYRYYTYSYPFSCLGYIKYTVSGSIFSNGHIYYVISFVRNGPDCNNYNRFFHNLNNIRIDSISGNIYKNLIELCIIDSLKSSLYNSYTSCTYASANYVQCTEIFNLNIFNNFYPAKKFNLAVSQGSDITIYAEGLGVYNAYASRLTNSSDYTLKGCRINGVIFGDTSLTGISKISTEIPSQFKLFQNYPNPFNPVTKIRFALPPSPSGEGLGVRLTVYDILGREVATLVNEQLSPGSYEIEWDGINYPSGMYFYTMTSGRYAETKKMIIVK